MLPPVLISTHFKSPHQHEFTYFLLALLWDILLLRLINENIKLTILEISGYISIYGITLFKRLGVGYWPYQNFIYRIFILWAMGDAGNCNFCFSLYNTFSFSSKRVENSDVLLWRSEPRTIPWASYIMSTLSWQFVWFSSPFAFNIRFPNARIVFFSFYTPCRSWLEKFLTKLSPNPVVCFTERIPLHDPSDLNIELSQLMGLRNIIGLLTYQAKVFFNPHLLPSWAYFNCKRLTSPVYEKIHLNASTTFDTSL